MDTCPRRGRRPDPSKRAAIVDAAGSLFCSHGYGVTMEAIAAEAGVSKQTIYNLFSTKEQLFGAVVATRSQVIVTAIPAPAETLPTPEGLLRIAREFVWFMTGGQVSQVYRLMLQASPDAALTQAFYDNGPKRALAQLAAWFRARDAAGDLRIDDARLAAEGFFGLLNGQILIRNMLGLQTHWSDAELEAKARYGVEMFLARHAR